MLKLEEFKMNNVQLPRGEKANKYKKIGMKVGLVVVIMQVV